MNSQNLHRIFTLFICQSLVFSPLVYAEQLSLPASDLIAPEIVHEVNNNAIEEGTSLQLNAKVTDNAAVKTVILYYRVIGSIDFNSIGMYRVDESDTYSVSLGRDQLVSPGIEYYIQATDVSGNSLLNGHSFSPLKVSVSSGLASPLVQSNEHSLVSANSALQKEKSNTWLWIGLGVLAVGAMVSSSGGDDVTPPRKATIITVGAPVPINGQQ